MRVLKAGDSGRRLAGSIGAEFPGPAVGYEELEPDEAAGVRRAAGSLGHESTGGLGREDPPLQRRFGVAFCCKFGLLVGAVMCLVMAAARYAYPLGDGPLLAALVGAQLLYGVGFSATSVRNSTRGSRRC